MTRSALKSPTRNLKTTCVVHSSVASCGRGSFRLYLEIGLLLPGDSYWAATSHVQVPLLFWKIYKVLPQPLRVYNAIQNNVHLICMLRKKWVCKSFVTGLTNLLIMKLWNYMVWEIITWCCLYLGVMWLPTMDESMVLIHLLKICVILFLVSLNRIHTPWE